MRCRETALHLALIFGHIETAKALVASGADVHATDSDGYPLVSTQSTPAARTVRGRVTATGTTQRKSLRRGLLARFVQCAPCPAEGRGSADIYVISIYIHYLLCIIYVHL
jgi:hypothetical protein